MTDATLRTAAWPTAPLDRLLARAIGQPLSVSTVLEHGRVGSRLDLCPAYAVLEPETEPPEVTKLGGGPGSLGNADTATAERIMQNGESRGSRSSEGRRRRAALRGSSLRTTGSRARGRRVYSRR